MHHNLIAYIGRFGSGKSLALVSKAIELANRYKLIIVTNIKFDMGFFHQYCKLMKFRFAPFTRIIYLDMAVSQPSDFFNYSNSVVIFDEAGIYLNARFWKSTGKDFLSALFQLRHDNITLLCGFQFWEQVDKQLRDVVQLIVLCTSIAPKDRLSGRPKLIGFWRHHYEPEAFNKLSFDSPSPLKAWMMAARVEHQLLFVDIFLSNLFCFISNCFIFFRSLLLSIPFAFRSPVLPTLLVFKIYNSFVPSSRTSKIKFKSYLVWEDDFIFDSQPSTGILGVWDY
jgi:hypothetical protein